MRPLPRYVVISLQLIDFQNGGAFCLFVFLVESVIAIHFYYSHTAQGVKSKENQNANLRLTASAQ